MMCTPRVPLTVVCPLSLSALQLIDSEDQTELLYIDTLWRVVRSKWEYFGRSRFLFFVALNVVSLISQARAHAIPPPRTPSAP